MDRRQFICTGASMAVAAKSAIAAPPPPLVIPSPIAHWAGSVDGQDSGSLNLMANKQGAAEIKTVLTQKIKGFYFPTGSKDDYFQVLPGNNDPLGIDEFCTIKANICLGKLPEYNADFVIVDKGMGIDDSKKWNSCNYSFGINRPNSNSKAELTFAWFDNKSKIWRSCFSSGAALQERTNYRVAVTVGPETPGSVARYVKFYLDGELVCHPRYDESIGAKWGTKVNKGLTIGGTGTNGGGMGNGFNGWIWEVRIWDVTLLQEMLQGNK